MIDATQIDPFALPSVPVGELSSLPETSGIYFVLGNDQVLYIGQSTSIRQRWQAHHKTQELEAYSQVRVAWLEAEYGELAGIERIYIAQFKPSLNSMLVPKGRTQKTIYLPPRLARRLDMRALQEGRERSEIVADALDLYLRSVPLAQNFEDEE